MQISDGRDAKRMERERRIRDEIRDNIAELDDEFSNVQVQFDAIKRRYDQLQADLVELHRQADFWTTRLGEEKSKDEDVEPALPHTHEDDLSDVLRRVPHGDVAKRILEASGSPLGTNEIIRRIEATGHPLPSGDKGKVGAVYSAMLRRKSEFVRLGNGIWGLVGRDDGPKRRTGNDSDDPRIQSNQEATRLF